MTTSSSGSAGCPTSPGAEIMTTDDSTARQERAREVLAKEIGWALPLTGNISANISVDQCVPAMLAFRAQCPVLALGEALE